jgi:proteasome lid subunit RPN8/RPN11
MIDHLELSQDQIQFMCEHVEAEIPFEACGLIGGTGIQAIKVMSISNILKSPVRFRMHPQEQIEAFTAFEAQGLELLAIYHSHPTGPAQPSPTDLAEAYYPEALTLIWSHLSGDWTYRAFRLVDGSFQEATLVVQA